MVKIFEVGVNPFDGDSSDRLLWENVFRRWNCGCLILYKERERHYY